MFILWLACDIWLSVADAMLWCDRELMWWKQCKLAHHASCQCTVRLVSHMTTDPLAQQLVCCETVSFSGFYDFTSVSVVHSMTVVRIGCWRSVFSVILVQFMFLAVQRTMLSMMPQYYMIWYRESLMWTEKLMAWSAWSSTHNQK